MSFSLPRSPRGLSFTGSQPAATAQPAPRLGKARVRTPVPIKSPLPDKVEIREIEPFIAPDPMDDDMPTSSFNPDALDFLAPTPMQKPLPPKSVQSVFNVTKAVSADSPATVLVPGRKKEKAGATQGRILMFVMIGLLSMFVGYRFVPMMLDRFDPPPPAEQ